MAFLDYKRKPNKVYVYIMEYDKKGYEIFGKIYRKRVYSFGSLQQAYLQIDMWVNDWQKLPYELQQRQDIDIQRLKDWMIELEDKALHFKIFPRYYI